MSTSLGFAEALRAAITARGLSLERLRDHLARRGVSLSFATLSYWQTGRSLPERRASLLAVGHLEDVLEVAPGTLTALLAPGVRAIRRQENGIGALWPAPAVIDDVVGQVDTHWDHRLTRISQHDHVTVGPERGERRFLSRQVLRAEEDGPDRWVAIVHLDEHDRPLPLIRPRHNCRLGRVVTRPGEGLLVAELLFRAPLRRGQTVITEHEIVNHAPYPLATNYERKFRRPVHEYVLEVSFDGAALPRTCTRHVTDVDGTRQEFGVRLDEGNAVHGVALKFGPGCYGFEWSW
ncbi:multiprotein-bridging factor 1 family protein [Lentzea sp. NPDC051213]|uniref:multiprotein-bridging factor 1 family protein n=1 Tax=Lentzea sp. NPDC051213 TaxID=3364126 RepID=UPI0037A7B32D